MLSELTPDEARILRLFATSGQQPAVDVRAGFAFVPGSRLVMQGYSMIAAEAGCRFVDQIPAYLSNLNRLGLIWFSHDPVRDRERYQVLEVQPEVLGALRDAGRFSYVLRRSIHLTPLGEDFCEKALLARTRPSSRRSRTTRSPTRHRRAQPYGRATGPVAGRGTRSRFSGFPLVCCCSGPKRPRPDDAAVREDVDPSERVGGRSLIVFAFFRNRRRTSAVRLPGRWPAGRMKIDRGNQPAKPVCTEGLRHGRRRPRP